MADRRLHACAPEQCRHWAPGRGYVGSSPEISTTPPSMQHRIGVEAAGRGAWVACRGLGLSATGRGGGAQGGGGGGEVEHPGGVGGFGWEAKVS